MTRVTASPASLVQQRAGLADWIRNHDESWLFIACYVGLAVVLSVWISLFWLGVVVAGHFALELWRQKLISPRGYIRRALWEIKLDIALVGMALALAVYMDLLLGVVGAQSAARATAVAQKGLKAGSRFAAWERAIRGFLLSADDVAQVARAAAARAARGRSPVGELPSLSAGPLVWSRGDRFAVALGATSLLLILLAPLWTEHTIGSVAALLLEQVRPFP
jgi:hypothetical protein